MKFLLTNLAATLLLSATAVAQDLTSTDLTGCPKASEEEAMGAGFELLPVPQPVFYDAPAMKLVGVNATIDAHKTNDFAKIPIARETFAAMLPEVQNKVNPATTMANGTPGDVTYSVCFTRTGETGFDFMHAVEVSDIAAVPFNATAIELPPQKYAIFHYEGPREAIGSFRWSIQNYWPTVDIKPYDGADGLPNIEVYRPGDDGFSPGVAMDVWVPIDPESVS